MPLDAVLEDTKLMEEETNEQDDAPFHRLPPSLHAEISKHDILVSFDTNNDGIPTLVLPAVSLPSLHSSHNCAYLVDQLENILEREKGIPWLVLLALFLTWACFVVAIFL